MNDPWTGKEEYYNKAVFEDRWTAMGKQALTVKAETIKTPSFYYDDVFVEDWYYGIIDEMTAMGIVCGYGDRTFRPMDDCTYGEFIKLAKDMMYQKTFPNNSGEWYDPIVEESVNNAIMTEVNKYIDTKDDTYLNTPILRKDVAQILLGLLSDEEITDELKARMAILYKDTSELNQEEIAAFAYVENEGIIFGNNFEMNPEEQLTRTEVLIIRKRVIKNGKYEVDKWSSLK
ncbi:MAG: S-layer homology domain-containing protein [Peptostreptococcaceae bacterium]|nr:S-layer homology domain-containing protein [Peptostreptococcaceae bacterium]